MKWRTICIDPPWQYRTGWGAISGDNSEVKRKLAYGTMTLDELAVLPVGEWAEENSHLYLWVTNSMLREGLVLARAWGFEQKTMLTWCKPALGMGYWYRNTTEHVLFCVRGKLKISKSNLPTHFTWPRGRHSAKPQGFYDMVEDVSPGPWLDVFARRQRMGWDVFGNEVYTHESISRDLSPVREASG